MNISYNWLRQYVAHDLSPEALAETLTMGGLEVDEVTHSGAPIEGVVVGEVLAVRPHPNADRLVLCDVNLGDDEQVQIACGAPNVAAAQKVPVVTVGSTLHLRSRENPDVREPMTIKKVKLRGEISEGMICSEDELGFSEDHAGIMVLAPEAEVGIPFSDFLAGEGLRPQDAVLDIELTPNRPDAASHIGVARDVAALTGSSLQLPDVTLPERAAANVRALRKANAAAQEISVTIDAPEACPRYVAMLVRGITVGPSPLWLQQRLRTIGLQPRNNVVDVTNFVLHECGQPLHAFDLGRLAGPSIHVRLTEGKETFTTLDDVERTLPKGALLICDAEQPVAIAGVMGGENSEVSDTTTDVLIESAYFVPSTIRRTAKALGLQTDASYRFERGVDRDGQIWAAARAAELIAELAGGEIVPGCVDEHPGTFQQTSIELRLDRLTRVVGAEIPEETAAGLLRAIGFDVSVTESDGALHCTAPTFRPDVTIEEDLIEEVARLYGYDNISEPAFSRIPSRVPHTSVSNHARSRARALLAGLGFREAYTNSLLGEREAERFAADPIVETLNPISREMAALRPSLLPGLLAVMRHNHHHGRRALRFMEWGKVFRREDSNTNGTFIPGYNEHESFLLVLAGPHAPNGWDVTPRPSDFFDLKGTVEVLLQALGLENDVSMTPLDGERLVDYGVSLAIGDENVGVLGRLPDESAVPFDLGDEAVFFAELNWGRLVGLSGREGGERYSTVTRFPVVERDLAVVVARSTYVGDMLDAINEAGRPLLQEAGVFDLYQGEHITKGRKSVAFSLRFAADRTLRDEEVDKSIASILNALEDRYDASLRE